jgi:hypothetical protein
VSDQAPATLPDLATIAAPLVQAIVPGWSLTWEWVTPEAIGGALAQVRPTPLRSMAHIQVAPHPPGESLAETLAHELTHVAISPLTQFLPMSAEAIAIEEPIVERLSLALAHLAPNIRRAAGRALSRLPPALRARVAAPSPTITRNRMDGMLMLLAGLKAALGLDDPKPALESLISEAEKIIGAGDAQPADPPAEAAAEGEAPAMAMARALGSRVMKRLGVATDAQALLRIEAGEVAIAEVAKLRKEKADRDAAEENVAKVALVKQRHAAGTLTRAQAFTADSITLSDAATAKRAAGDMSGPEPVDLLVPKPEWLGGKLADLKRTLDALGTPHAPAKREEPEEAPADGAIPAHVAAYCRARNITDPKKIARFAALIQEQAR